MDDARAVSTRPDDAPAASVHAIEVDARRGRSPEPVRQRLRELSDRFFGSHAIHMREQPVPWAYRVFFRHVGLDPDETRTPVERLALERLQRGAFRSRGLPDDALVIATVETGVALVAFDAGRLSGGLTVRASRDGEPLRGARSALEPGTLVLADRDGPVCVLFGDPPEAVAATKETRRLALVAIRVDGVPEPAAQEALEIAAGALASGSRER
jgi:DNA/RNA-binding domain of Phe-tRNA-synthetase-like protein